MFPLLFIGLTLIGEFSSLDEPTKVPEVVTIVVFSVDRPKFTRAERLIRLKRIYNF
jgi:hypothetical protein